jgi:acetyl-CoA C-acetyltransferase
VKKAANNLQWMERLRQLSRHVTRSPPPPGPPRAVLAAAAAAAALDDSALEQTPVIIGVARVTPRVEITADSFPPSPTDHVEAMARQAARDTGLSEAMVLEAITGVSISSPPSRIFPNMSASLGDRLGCDLRQLYTHQRAMGGDAVQAATNLMADRISQGHEGIIACAHVMTTETQRQYYRQFPERKIALQEAWFEDPGVGPPTEVSGEADDGVKSHPEFFHSFEEARHGLDQPIEIYPVIENALRQRYGAPFAQHQQKISQYATLATPTHGSDLNLCPASF